MSSTHTPGEESPDDDEIFPFIVDADTDRGQHIFCQNLLVNLFEPGISPCKTEFPDVKIKRQIIDHYLKDICNITQQYGIYSIEFTSPNHNNRKYTIQTDDLDLEFSKVFSEYIKSIQYHNSQRANSIFTNEVFAIIYSYISILENEIPITNVSPTETSKHLRVRHEITLLSSYLNIIKENFTKDDVSQHTKHDLQKILAWFIIDYFTHNIDLIAQARKNFRPQNSNDDTAITEQSDYVWDPEWSHPAFISFPQTISSQAISTISYIRDYVKVIPLTIDATPLNYNTFLPDTQNNSLNSTVIHNENLNGTRNLTQQDIQTPSHFINEEIVHTTTTQQSISPIRPNLTTPRNTNPSQTQVTLQSTVKPSVAPKYSHMDYQTYRPMTIPSKTRKTFTRNNFADHNYNYTHPSKTYNQPQRNFNQYTRSRNWDNPMTQPNSINFQTNPPQDHSENYPFFQQNKNKKQTSYQMDYLSSDDDFLQPDIFAPNTQEYRRQGIQKTRTIHRNFSPQPIDAQHQQPKGNTFINPVIILAKGESLKIVLDARYLNSLIDESKCNWPIEPIQVILTKINGKYFTTADMNSAYNQTPLDEQSRRLTQFVIGNQQYEFNRLFYGISIGPAAFSAFMSKIFRPLILKKNAITYLDDVFMQSQTKDEMFNVLEKYHQILQNENLKAAPDKSHFFLTRVKFLGHNIERKTITPLKSRIDAIQKLQPPTNKKKIQEFLGMLNFLSKYVYKMQLYLRPFYNILRQQNNFEWNTEHQTRFEEIKKLLTEQISNTIPDSNQPFYAMCDASNFGIGAALLQSHNGTNKMNLISANSRLFTQAELRLSTLMRECTAIIYTLTEYEFLILGSKHPTVLFTDHKPIIFLFTQKSNPNHRVYRFQLILMKFPNLHIVWTAGKNLALPDTLSRNTPPELLTRKTTVEIPKNIKFYLAENETSPRLECKYAVKTDIEQSQINSLQHFPLYLDCQNNHYEVDLLGTSTFKPIPYSQWIKNNTQQKRTKQHPPKKDHFPLIEKEDLTDKINLSGPQTNDSKYTINQVFDLHDPLDTIPLSKLEIENIFLPPTEIITISTLKQYQNLDPVIRQLKSWHKYKTKPIKADSTILGNKTLLRYFRKFNNTTINENTDLLEYNLNESTVPCLPFSMILIAFNISHTQNIKGHSGSEKTYSNFIQNFYFPNAPIWIKVLCNDCIVCQLNKPYPNQKQIAQKQDFKGQSLYFNHRISFDTKGPISPSSEGNSYIMVIVDAFTHYVALNPVPHCNAYYAYTTLYEHWIAKFGLPEILVTDNGTEFINNEIITLCHLYNIKHKPRTSHAPWTNGLVEGMNRSLQEYLRCIINGNDTKYTEWSADVKLFPLAYNSQITTTLGMSPYEMVFNQKPRKPIMFTANSHKNAQGYCQPNKDSICYNLPLHTHDEDHFHHPQILKLASGTHTEWILNRDKKHNEIYQKITKKLLQRQNINEQINSRFTPASELKIGTFVLIPNFNTQKGISKKLQPLRKGPYQIIAKPTDVTYKITDSNKKEIVQHRNNLLPYYPKEYALRELTQLYSFTGLKIIQNEPHLKNTEQNDNPTENQNTKPTATKNNTQNHKESPKQRKNRKMTEQIIPQEQIDKSENRKTTRLRNQPRKNYKIFIPQSKILKKVEFQK